MENQESTPVEQEKFFPKGAITFFMLLMVFIALVWFFVYFIMIYRGI